MKKNDEKPFYGYVALASTAFFIVVFLISGILVLLFFSILIGTLLILVGIYNIISYLYSIHLIRPHKTLDQSDVLKLQGNELILDAGCGLGRATIGLAKQLKKGKIIGVDIWNKMEIPGNSAERAYRNAEIEGVKDRVEFRFGDTFNLPFKDEHFDVVVCAGLITSFHNDELKLKALKELRRVLKTNGIFLMREPINNLKTIIIITPSVYFIRLPTKKHWRELLEKSAFENIEFYPHRVSGSFKMIKPN